MWVWQIANSPHIQRPESGFPWCGWCHGGARCSNASGLSEERLRSQNRGRQRVCVKHISRYQRTSSDPSLAAPSEFSTTYRGLKPIKTDRENTGWIYRWKFSYSFVRHGYDAIDVHKWSSEVVSGEDDLITHYFTSKAVTVKPGCDQLNLGQTN